MVALKLLGLGVCLQQNVSEKYCGKDYVVNMIFFFKNLIDCVVRLYNLLSVRHSPENVSNNKNQL